MPRDAHVVLSVLKSMGVEECDDRVVHQLLEFMYRYVGEVLGDASAYAGHADRSTLELDDVKLAMQARVNFAFAQPPPREVQLELSSARNRVPLPGLGAAKTSGGGIVALPPSDRTLSQRNFQVGSDTQPR